MLFQMKKYSGKLLLPLGKRWQYIPANYFTIGSCLVAIVVGFAFAFRTMWAAIPFLILIEFFDQLDGVVARLQGTTRLGAFLDSTLDRIGDFAILIGLFYGNYCASWIWLGCVVGTILTSYTRARIEGLGISSLGGIGILERTDRIPLLLIGSIFQIWFDSSLEITIILLLIGTLITVIQRIHFAVTHLKESANDKPNK